MKIWLKALVMLLIVSAVCVVGYFRFVYTEPAYTEELSIQMIDMNDSK
ncbi:hypothetical protein [Jeotgalibacillus aurantiacus]|nr:hypothetical protein [Jeotgalibacillus aurantiacus]